MPKACLHLLFQATRLTLCLPRQKDSMRNCLLALVTSFTLFIAPAQAQHLSTYQNQLTEPITVQELTSSFPASYEDSRARFVGYHRKLEKARIPALNLAADITIPDKETLTIDGLYITGEDTKKLLIVTSGIHGAEAFAGATIQDLFLQHLLKSGQPKTSILLIHAINPYGFKYLRRANPNNVDLNRNHASAEEFASTNEAFDKLASIYTPEAPASVGVLPQTGFYIAAFIKYVTQGKKIILNSLSGQYKYPKSVFYGGTTLEAESKAVQEWITTFAKDKTKIAHIDLHTGFGETGKLHFYGSDEYSSPEQIKNVQDLFPMAKVDTGHDADFYPTKGDFVDWTWKSHPQQTVIPMVFEFGTMNSQTIRGGLRSLWASILENQGYHNGFGTKHDRKLIRKKFEELFNPQNAKWQHEVATQGTEQLLNAYNKLVE